MRYFEDEDEDDDEEEEEGEEEEGAREDSFSNLRVLC